MNDNVIRFKPRKNIETHLKVKDIREYFIDQLKFKNFVEDRTGINTIELIGASFLADEPAIFGTPNEEYITAELDWYMSQSTNINDIYGEEKAPPSAWIYSANEHGEINSNYGYLVFDDKFYNQFDRVVDELNENPDTRRGTMIYTRPSIWTEYNDNGKNDFICTNAVSYYIRNGQLDCVVQMRSNDVYFGYRNDRAYQDFLLHTLASELKRDVTVGDIYWQVQNLHVYERHFHLIK